MENPLGKRLKKSVNFLTKTPPTVSLGKEKKKRRRRETIDDVALSTKDGPRARHISHFSLVHFHPFFLSFVSFVRVCVKECSASQSVSLVLVGARCSCLITSAFSMCCDRLSRRGGPMAVQTGTCSRCGPS